MIIIKVERRKVLGLDPRSRLFQYKIIDLDIMLNQARAGIYSNQRLTVNG